MEKTVSFRADVKKLHALEALAELQDRNWTYVLNEAIDYYLELQQYHIELIETGIREADSGQLVEHADVKKMAQRLKRSKKTIPRTASLTEISSADSGFRVSSWTVRATGVVSPLLAQLIL